MFILVQSRTGVRNPAPVCSLARKAEKTPYLSEAICCEDENAPKNIALNLDSASFEVSSGLVVWEV